MAAPSKLYSPGGWALGLLLATHPVPAAMNAIAGLAIFLIASRMAAYPIGALLLGSVFLVHASIGAMNDYVDEPTDRISNPGKPLVRCLVSRSQVLCLSLICGAGGLALAFVLGPGVPVAVLILAAGMAYNLGLKGTWLSWLPYAVFIPSVAVWAFLAAGVASVWLLATYPLGAMISVALNLANTLPDLEGDANVGTSGLAHRLGAERSRRAIAVAYAISGVLVAAIGFWLDVPLVALVTLLLGVSSGILLARLFAAHQRRVLRLAWHGSAIAAVLLAACWALMLERLISVVP